MLAFERNRSININNGRSTYISHNVHWLKASFSHSSTNVLLTYLTIMKVLCWASVVYQLNDTSYVYDAAMKPPAVHYEDLRLSNPYRCVQQSSTPVFQERNGIINICSWPFPGLQQIFILMIFPRQCQLEQMTSDSQPMYVKGMHANAMGIWWSSNYVLQY